MSLPAIDIDQTNWEIVSQILKQHVSKYEVWAFGSRVTGTSKKYSDLDLAIISDEPISLDTHSALVDAFSESDLPWKVDIIDWATTSERFRGIIKRNKVAIQIVDDGKNVIGVA